MGGRERALEDVRATANEEVVVEEENDAGYFIKTKRVLSVQAGELYEGGRVEFGILGPGVAGPTERADAGQATAADNAEDVGGEARVGVVPGHLQLEEGELEVAEHELPGESGAATDDKRRSKWQI